jgi:hypothetical protein
VPGVVAVLVVQAPALRQAVDAGDGEVAVGRGRIAPKSPLNAVASVSNSASLRLVTFLRRRVPGPVTTGGGSGSDEVADPTGYPFRIQLRKVCERSAVHLPAASGGMSAFGCVVWA